MLQITADTKRFRLKVCAGLRCVDLSYNQWMIEQTRDCSAISGKFLGGNYDLAESSMRVEYRLNRRNSRPFSELSDDYRL